MKKFVLVLSVIVILLSFSGCKGSAESNANSVPDIHTAEPTKDNAETVETPAMVESPVVETDAPEKSIDKLELGNEVSIIGQKANSTLVNDDTIWVQVLRDGERTIIYYCQLKDEYLEQGAELEILNVVKVKGYYLNTIDMAGTEGVNTPAENLAIMMKYFIYFS